MLSMLHCQGTLWCKRGSNPSVSLHTDHSLLSLPLAHSAWCPVPSSSWLQHAPSTCLYLSLASPISLQAYTPCQLFPLLPHSDLTGEHSCPATIPPHSLFCCRLFHLSCSAALDNPPHPISSLSISNTSLLQFLSSIAEDVIYFLKKSLLWIHHLIEAESALYDTWLHYFQGRSPSMIEAQENRRTNKEMMPIEQAQHVIDLKLSLAGLRSLGQSFLCLIFHYFVPFSLNISTCLAVIMHI